MPLIILHNTNNEKVTVNTDNISLAARITPDENSVVKDPYTKLYFVHKDKTLDGLEMPDTVLETPEEIADLAAKS